MNFVCAMHHQPHLGTCRKIILSLDQGLIFPHDSFATTEQPKTDSFVVMVMVKVMVKVISSDSTSFVHFPTSAPNSTLFCIRKQN